MVRFSWLTTSSHIFKTKNITIDIIIDYNNISTLTYKILDRYDMLVLIVIVVMYYTIVICKKRKNKK